MAAVAPAAARSGLPLADRPATLGNPLVELVIAGPALVRLFKLAVVAAVATEARLEEAIAKERCFWGLLPFRIEPGAFGLPPGGSGSGRGVDIVLLRLTGEESRIGILAVAGGSLWPVINSCRIASSGLSRLSGSHRRQRARNSMKASSSHFNTCCKVLEDGRLLLPLDETVKRGFPIESKKSFLLVLFSMRCFSGGPNTSMMQASCSCSFSPGKMGTPVNNSARMQPTLHISIGSPYVIPRITSGER